MTNKSTTPRAASRPTRKSALIWIPLRWVVHAMTAVSALAMIGMIGVTTTDVLARSVFGKPLQGAYDLVGMLGGAALFCALPYTTAVKGHVAVEFLFQKLGRRKRVLVDVFNRLTGMTFFACLAVFLGKRARSLQAAHEVTPTLQLPTYPVLWLGAGAVTIVILVIFHNLLHPGREMIRP